MQFNIPAEFKNASGVYIIRNTLNSKVYVGSAVNLKRRFYEHLSRLKKGKSYSNSLLKLVKIHGIECLVFELLEISEPYKEALISCEQKWLDYYKPHERDKGFNFLSTAYTSLGCKQTPETCAKISATKKGTLASAETRQKMSEAQKGRKRSPEARARMSEAQRKKSPETLAKMAASRIGFRHNEATIAKMSAISKTHRHTEETKQKISEISKKYWRENRENRPSQKGRVFSEEHRQRLSAAAKGRVISEEERQKLKDAWVIRATREKGSEQKLNSPEAIAKRTATRKANRLARLVNSPE